MKVLNKIGLVLFSIIVLLEGIAIILMVASWLDIDVVTNALEYITTDSVATKVTLIVVVILNLLALKCIFLNPESEDSVNSRDGILLENESGKLLVSRDTIESLTNSVVKNYETAQNVMTRVDLDMENNVSIFITLYVYPDAVIKDLTISLQKDIKESIKKSLDLDVKEVNVKIKNIATRKEVKD